MAKIKVQKNWNNKIGNEVMVHIMRPSKNSVGKDMFDIPIVFHVEGQEDSTDVTYYLYDYHEDILQDIPNNLILFSHGNMSREEFYTVMYKTYNLHSIERAGIYYFVKKNKHESF